MSESKKSSSILKRLAANVRYEPSLIGCQFMVILTFCVSLLYYLWKGVPFYATEFLGTCTWFLVLLFFLLVTCNTTVSIYKGIQLFGHSYFQNLPTMWSLWSRRYAIGFDQKRPSFHLTITLSSAFIILSLLLMILSESSIRISIGLPMLAFGLSYLLNSLFVQGSTPAILVLGASSSESIQIQNALSRGLNLYIGSISSLLNIRASNKEGAGVENSGGAQRVTDDDWPVVVRTLAKLVKLIVIDMRNLTPYVEEEIRWICAEELLEKCIFFAPQGVWAENTVEVRINEISVVTDINSIVVESEKVLYPTR